MIVIGLGIHSCKFQFQRPANAWQYNDSSQPAFQRALGSLARTYLLHSGESSFDSEHLCLTSRQTDNSTRVLHAFLVPRTPYPNPASYVTQRTI